MELLRWVAVNRLYYKGRTLTVGFLCGFLLFASVASAILMNNIAAQAEKPLKALNTELIIQKISDGKQADGYKTGGLIKPFNMESFPSGKADSALGSLSFIKGYSTSLILWKLDTKGTLVIAGIKKNDPNVGLRNIESMLVKGSFFSADDADEVILERHYAAFFGFKSDGIYEIQGALLKIVGIVDFVNQSNLNTAAVFLPYGTAERLSGTESGFVNQVYVSLASASDTEILTTKAQELLPDFQIITKDSLYKNLKGISGMMLSFGKAVTAVLFGAGLLLIFFMLKIHSYDFRRNSETLNMLGWRAGQTRGWVALDCAYILLIGVIFCLLLTIVFVFAGLPAVHIAPPALQELVL